MRPYYSCAVCGREDVRLYRPPGAYVTPENARCNEHLRPGKNCALVEAEGAMVWALPIPVLELQEWLAKKDAK